MSLNLSEALVLSVGNVGERAFLIKNWWEGNAVLAYCVSSLEGGHLIHSNTGHKLVACRPCFGCPVVG